MKEYSYHPYYKYYMSENIVLSSPLEPGQYLVSASATIISPPQIEENQIQIFDEKNKSWNIIEDLRGTYYNVFTGVSLYNENPFEKPDHHTRIKPPVDYNQNNYKWNHKDNFWEKIDPIYHTLESELKNLSTKEKLEKLNLSIDTLKEELGINTYLDEVKNALKIFEVVDSSLEDKFQFLNINQDQVKDFLGLSEIINSPLENKLNLLNFDIEDLKNTLEITKLLQIVQECKLEQNLLLHQIRHFSNIFEDYFSKTSLNSINPINLYNISILRPYEIVQTSQKFQSDNSILDSLFIGICLDTGERKFGDGITPWNDLPFALQTQRFRFSRSSEKWASDNPIPGADIECYEIDTDKIKIGNGFLPWEKLPYEGA